MVQHVAEELPREPHGAHQKQCRKHRVCHQVQPEQQPRRRRCAERVQRKGDDTRRHDQSEICRRQIPHAVAHRRSQAGARWAPHRLRPGAYLLASISHAPSAAQESAGPRPAVRATKARIASGSHRLFEHRHVAQCGNASSRPARFKVGDQRRAGFDALCPQRGEQRQAAVARLELADQHAVEILCELGRNLRRKRQALHSVALAFQQHVAATSPTGSDLGDDGDPRRGGSAGVRHGTSADEGCSIRCNLRVGVAVGCFDPVPCVAMDASYEPRQSNNWSPAGNFG